MPTQWLNGEPSYSVSITAAEALEEIQDAAMCAREHYIDRDKRIRLSLAMAWLENRLSAHKEGN